MKPLGRSHSDFLDGSNALPESERKLCAAARAGVTCIFDCPDKPFPENGAGMTIRAAFLRFLLLGGDEDVVVHESGVLLQGAFIDGLLNLDESEVKYSFSLKQCTLSEGVCFNDASIRGFAFDGCKVGVAPKSFGENVSIVADRMRSTGTVVIAGGSEIVGKTSFSSAKIGGNLTLITSVFGEGEGTSLDLVSAQIGGDVVLGVSSADERVRSTTTFGGYVVLSNATIVGSIKLQGSIIRSPNTALAALFCPALTIQGSLEFSRVVEIQGVSLLGAKIGTLDDDIASWQSGVGRHRLNGLVYDRIADDARSIDRVKWLMMQRPADLARSSGVFQSGLRRQPWQHAAKVLEAGGDMEGAREIRIALERQATRTGSPWRWAVGKFYDGVCGYGYSPGRLFLFTLLFWMLGTFAADRIAKAGHFEATDSKAASPTQCTPHCEASQLVGGLFSGYCTPDGACVYPWLYSADNLIPVIDLGQKKAWRPNHMTGLLYGLLIIENIFGFIAGSALVATLGSFVVRKVS